MPAVQNHSLSCIASRDSLLSLHVSTPEDAGYLRVTKRQEGRRTRTWLSLTPRGREALARHLDVLNRMATAPG